MFKKPYRGASSGSDTGKKRIPVWSAREPEKRLEKYDFEKMKSAALSPELGVRKLAFLEYFERFSEFPSFLFDNDGEIDQRFLSTIQDIEKDPEVGKPVLVGIVALRERLSF